MERLPNRVGMEVAFNCRFGELVTQRKHQKSPAVKKIAASLNILLTEWGEVHSCPLPGRFITALVVLNLSVIDTTVGL